MTAGGTLRAFAILTLTASLALASFLALPLRAQVSFNGPEFVVNSFTPDAQLNPSVAVDGYGNLIFTWVSNASGGTDTDSSSIQMRRFDPAARALGPDFQVNTFTPYGQSYSAVAAHPGGSFAVVWMSWGSDGPDTDDWSILAQRFSAVGLPLDGEIPVNEYTAGAQLYPEVAPTGQGGFVTVWEIFSAHGTDTSEGSIWAQRFGPDGSRTGAEFQVNEYTTGRQSSPAVAADSAGNFVIAWSSDGSSGSDTDYWSIQARCFGADGTPRGTDFQVNTFTPDFQAYPDVAMAAEGNFVVVWQGRESEADSRWGIHARTFDAGCSPQGSEFQVNEHVTDAQYRASVAATPGGGFVVAWTSLGSSGSDTSYSSIQARRFGADGLPTSAEFQVNTYTTSNQHSAAVAADRYGNFVVAWDSNGSFGPDTASYSILAQRFDQLFRDGFESGDAARWSAAVP